MSFRSALLAAALGLAALPATASADTLHGPPRPRRTVVVRGHGHARHAGHTRQVRTPRVHVHRHGRCCFVEGHHSVRRRRVVIPGHHVERVIPARYAVRWRGGRYVQVEVQSRRVVRDWVPERIETRRRRVWVPGRWVCS